MIEKITSYANDKLKLKERMRKVKIGLGIFAAGAVVGVVYDQFSSDEHDEPQTETSSQHEACVNVSVDEQPGSGAQERVVDPAFDSIYNGTIPEDTYTLRLNAAKKIDIHPGQTHKVCVTEDSNNRPTSIDIELVD